MTNANPSKVASPSNWALGKRAFHWGLALSVLVALVAPKPEHGEGLVHVIAGSAALLLVLTRIGWRASGQVRPFLKDAFRFRRPDLARGPKAFAPLMMQSARVGGFLFLALIPVAVGLALAGVSQGEESALLEAHEAAGTAIMVLAIAHVAAVLIFTLLTRYDVIRVTLAGGARSFLEGGKRGLLGLTVGAALGAGVLAWAWGPFDLQGRLVAGAEMGRHGAGEHGGGDHEGNEDD